MPNEINQIALFEKPLFTWYKLPLSIDGELDLPAESCFAYILEGDNQDLTDSGFLAEKGTVILSLCGKTVGNSLSKIETAFLSTIIVHFDREVLKKVFNYEKPKFWEELEHPLKKDIAQQDASALVSAYFLNVADLFHHKNALNEDILSVKLKEIVLLLLQTQESSNLNAIARSLFSDRIFSFQEVIEANLYEPLNLNRLAAMTNNSLASFKRNFRKIYNNSPANYIKEKKLERGKKLLNHSQKSIGEICYECGYADPSSFARSFKNRFGISPLDLRLSQNAH
ncbi:AraC family transcriptional regulator [Cyclobacterium amurskyense]|uniref:AraC family transcriptional regulator n=1 Tax=Cyclobacterium amurskyense TaxID=320787 RepID=UPI0030D76EB9|tara:strand:- start:8937 stop:9785 length:849 start_codon:yes stop_codon:yes gene_type:complete